MPELSISEISALGEFLAPLTNGFASALSENINQQAELEAPIINQHTINDLIADASPVLQTTFGYPALGADECALIFPGTDAPILADMVGLGDGSEPAAELGEEQMTLLSTAMAGVAQSFGLVIGAAIDKAVVPGPECATLVAPVALSAGFLISGCGVEIGFPYTVGSAVKGMFRILLCPDVARALLGGPAQVQPVPSAGSTLRDQAEFQPFEVVTGGLHEAMPRGMDLILDIPLEVSVELGRVQMLIKDVLDLAAGSIVELDRVAGEPLDLLVNGQLIAKGEVVVIEDNFGIRITEIISPADRLSGVAKRA